MALIICQSAAVQFCNVYEKFNRKHNVILQIVDWSIVIEKVNRGNSANYDN